MVQDPACCPLKPAVAGKEKAFLLLHQETSFQMAIDSALTAPGLEDAHAVRVGAI